MANYTLLIFNLSCQVCQLHMQKENHDFLFDREKSIFECMIANLFEEYRFFPKYPERQLRIASVLFGEWVLYMMFYFM